MTEQTHRRLHVLIVEDQDHKRDAIIGTVLKIQKDAIITNAQSVRGALNALKADANTTQPDVILLDMGLPVFDPSLGDRRNFPLALGGKEVLFNLEFDDRTIPVIVISATDDIKGLKEDLEGVYTEHLLDVVQFKSGFADWRYRVQELITEKITSKWPEQKKSNEVPVVPDVDLEEETLED